MENSEMKEFNHEASLKVIYEMIESAKSRIGKNYFYYLFWGYLIAATCIIEYVLIRFVNYPKHYMVWNILMPAGMIVTAVFYFMQKKTDTSKTFIGTTMKYLMTGWIISFMILLFFACKKHNFDMILPVSMAAYGLAIFVSGGMVGFKPLILGALVAWICSVASFFAPYPVQLLIMVGVVVVSYIIPGYLLKSKSNS
jgi:hypothetical protein